MATKEDTTPERITTDTDPSTLTPQTETSGPTNPQVDDSIVNELTNDDVIASFPKTKNEFGTEQVIIDANGFIKGLAPEDQPVAAEEAN